MKPVVFHIDKHIVTYTVDWLGIETIQVNESIISKKLSLPSRKHRFNLSLNKENVPFYIVSKQSFSTSTIEVSLYKNDNSIEKQTLELYKQENTATDNQGSTYILGLVFVVMSLVFDWHKFFLFIGLVLLFYAFVIKPNTKIKDHSNQESQSNSTNL
ncbi:hypothetical protein [Winogradskyella sp.]|uniref:hypothetical protein n=1 Tax=Winogradskyella sp. TaxID=1883156 RepID=UPI003F6B999E